MQVNRYIAFKEEIIICQLVGINAFFSWYIGIKF